MEWSILLAVEGIAVLWDLCTHRIPNWLIITGLLFALSWQVTVHGPGGAWGFLSGSGIALLLFSILHYFRMIGAGDIKLFMVAGSFLGPAELLKLIFLSFLIAAIYAMAVLIKHRILVRRLIYFKQYLERYFNTGEWEPYIKNDRDEAYLCFALPIFLGTIILRGGIL